MPPSNFAGDTLFQSTPPHGGRRSFLVPPRPGQPFQSTPPHGGRHGAGCDRPLRRGVSIHAPAWGATRWLPVSLAPSRRGFNPRPRMGGDLPARLWRQSARAFQSTPPHGGRLTRPDAGREGAVVSIHAPAWGATAALRGHLINKNRFNPRPRMGGDIFCCTILMLLHVSIHAPAWGATLGGDAQAGQRDCFNPRPRMGGDEVSMILKNAVLPFQSTPPHGGRHSRQRPGRMRNRFQSTPPHGGRRSAYAAEAGRRARFNPRPRMGGDGQVLVIGRAAEEVSIHAPAWGATEALCGRADGVGAVSIHAPAWGATLPCLRRGQARHVSIHAPAWGATAPGSLTKARRVFQSTPPHGGRQGRARR